MIAMTPRSAHVPAEGPGWKALLVTGVYVAGVLVTGAPLAIGGLAVNGLLEDELVVDEFPAAELAVDSLVADGLEADRLLTDELVAEADCNGGVMDTKMDTTEGVVDEDVVFDPTEDVERETNFSFLAVRPSHTNAKELKATSARHRPSRS